MPTRAPALLALAVTLALAATLGLGACGGDDDATADPSAATTATPRTSPIADPYRTEAPTAESARQFIERWNTTETAMENTGDSSNYRAMTRGCEPCRKTANQIDAIYDAGGRVLAEGRRILFIRQLPSAEGYTVFRVGFDVGTTRYVERPDADPQSFPGGKRTYQFELKRAGAWRLTNLYVVSS